MKHGSLFSGIGGFDLAGEWMGWENVFHCENNPFGQKILKQHFPKSKSYDDITKTDFSIHRGQLDVLTGGFPCQPWSLAGDQLGENDERHLFPEMLRAARETETPWIVGENVFGITSPKFRIPFEQICSSLENEGYKVQPIIIPASVVDTWHERKRIWFIAYSDSFGRKRRENGSNSENRGGGVVVPKSNLRDVINQIGEVKAGQALSPNLSEWLMGYPKDWTLLIEDKG